MGKDYKHNTKEDSYIKKICRFGHMKVICSNKQIELKGKQKTEKGYVTYDRSRVVILLKESFSK